MTSPAGSSSRTANACGGALSSVRRRSESSPRGSGSRSTAALLPRRAGEEPVGDVRRDAARALLRAHGAQALGAVLGEERAGAGKRAGRPERSRVRLEEIEEDGDPLTRGRACARLEIGERAGEPVATGGPAVLLDPPGGS